MKQMIIKFVVCSMCVMSIFISCNDDDEDNDDPNYAYRSIQLQQHKEYQPPLPAEILACLNDTFPENPTPDQTGLKCFAATDPIEPDVTCVNTNPDSLEKPQPL